MKRFFIAVILLSILPCHAVQWVQVEENTQIDIDSIEPFINDYGKIESNRFIFWVKKTNTHNHTFNHLESYYKKEIGYFVDKEIIDCQLKKIAIKANNIYDTNSNLMNRFDIPDYRQDWHYIAPDTPEQKLYDEVFKYKVKLEAEQKRIEEEKRKAEEAKKQAELESIQPVTRRRTR